VDVWGRQAKVPQFFLPLVKSVLDGRISGIDFAGVVTKAPDGCGFSVGDEVFGTVPPTEMMAEGGTGSFAEAVRCPADCINHKPRNMSWEAASAIPLVGLTVLQAFREANLQSGHHVWSCSRAAGQIRVNVRLKHLPQKHSFIVE